MATSERLMQVQDMQIDAMEAAVEIVERSSPPPYDRPATDAERLENTIMRAANIQAAATLAASMISFGMA